MCIKDEGWSRVADLNGHIVAQKVEANINRLLSYNHTDSSVIQMTYNYFHLVGF